MLANFREWLKDPFRAPVSAMDLFWIIGLVLVLMIFWRIILRHIFETIE